MTLTVLGLALGALILLEWAGADLDRRACAELEWHIRHGLFYRP